MESERVRQESKGRSRYAGELSKKHRIKDDIEQGWGTVLRDIFEFLHQASPVYGFRWLGAVETSVVFTEEDFNNITLNYISVEHGCI